MTIMTVIRLAEFPQDANGILDIWLEFVANSPVDLSYQENGEEFSIIPGKYAMPNGRIILAIDGGQILGCVALRKVSSEICEMKRLYVRPNARDARLGFKLVDRAILEAKSAGYSEIRLDVMAKSLAARKLYEITGFLPADPISFNPEPDAAFLGLKI